MSALEALKEELAKGRAQGRDLDSDLFLGCLQPVQDLDLDVHLYLQGVDGALDIGRVEV